MFSLAYVVTRDYNESMRTIGVRQLKAELSQVLRDVQRGDVVLVTDRGRVVAELRQPREAPYMLSPLEAALAQMSASGELRIAERPASVYQASPIKSPTGESRALLDAERGDE